MSCHRSSQLKADSSLYLGPCCVSTTFKTSIETCRRASLNHRGHHSPASLRGHNVHSLITADHTLRDLSNQVSEQPTELQNLQYYNFSSHMNNIFNQPKPVSELHIPRPAPRDGALRRLLARRRGGRRRRHVGPRQGRPICPKLLISKLPASSFCRRFSTSAHARYASKSPTTGNPSTSADSPRMGGEAQGRRVH